MPIGATIGAAGIGAAGALGAGYMASQGGKKAGELYDPWMNTGNSALMTLSKLYGLNGQGGGAFNPEALAQFRNTPGYQFTQLEGDRGINNLATVSGGLLSSNNLRNLSTFNSGLADKTFMNSYVSPLMSIAQGGLTAAQGKAGALTNSANQMAGGFAGAANAGIGALGNYMNYQNSQNNNAALLKALGNNNSAYSQPGTAANGGWSTSTNWN